MFWTHIVDLLHAGQYLSLHACQIMSKLKQQVGFVCVLLSIALCAIFGQEVDKGYCLNSQFHCHGNYALSSMRPYDSGLIPVSHQHLEGF